MKYQQHQVQSSFKSKEYVIVLFEYSSHFQVILILSIVNKNPTAVGGVLYIRSLGHTRFTVQSWYRKSLNQLCVLSISRIANRLTYRNPSEIEKSEIHKEICKMLYLFARRKKSSFFFQLANKYYLWNLSKRTIATGVTQIIF